MKVKEAAFIGYPVTDIARAKAFYEGVLHLTPTMGHEIAGMEGKWWIEYDLGNVTLAISNTWEPSGGGGPTVALEVESLDEAVATLREANTSIQAERIETPVCAFALATDPDGNAIMIHQRKADCGH